MQKIYYKNPQLTLEVGDSVDFVFDEITVSKCFFAGAQKLELYSTNCHGMKSKRLFTLVQFNFVCRLAQWGSASNTWWVKFMLPTIYKHCPQISFYLQMCRSKGKWSLCFDVLSTAILHINDNRSCNGENLFTITWCHNFLPECIKGLFCLANWSSCFRFSFFSFFFFFIYLGGRWASFSWWIGRP